MLIFKYLKLILSSSLLLPCFGKTNEKLCSASISSASSNHLKKLAEEEPVLKKMPMRILGNTGLQVSILSFGFWATFGAKDDLKEDSNGIQKAKEILHVCRMNGINFFDNAETYGTPRGAAELIMGQAIKDLSKEYPNLWQRSQILISTKLFWGFDGLENQVGLSRKHIIEGMDAALERLQVDYVDLVFCHRPDSLTPTETVVRAMTDLIRSGKALYWGTSEWSAQQYTEAFWIAKLYNLEPPYMEQPQYNLLHRERFETEYFPLYNAPYNMGTTIWSPLASGILTGKYNTADGSLPNNSRAASNAFIKQRIEKLKDDGVTLDKIQQLKDFAETNLECTVTQLSIAWCCRNMKVSTVLLGATSVKQLKENLESINVAMRMTREQDDIVEDIIHNKPSVYYGFGGAGFGRAWNRLEGLTSDKRMRIESYGNGLPLPGE